MGYTNIYFFLPRIYFFIIIALSTEGIFRLSGNVKRIAMLQTIFDTPNDYGLQLNWHGYTVHDASNVMRRFLNYLPEPVITLTYQPLFKATLLGNNYSIM